MGGDPHFEGQVMFGLLLIATMLLALVWDEHVQALKRQRRKEGLMSRYAINRVADEYGVSHRVAMLIWESVETPAEFRAAVEDYAAGRGFSIID